VDGIEQPNDLCGFGTASFNYRSTNDARIARACRATSYPRIIKRLSAFLTILLLLISDAWSVAVPLLGRPQEIDGVRIYPDSVNPSIFYYAPGKLLIPVDASGAPEISFLQMRYMGTSVSGDKGEFRTQSILSFRVKMASIEAKRIALVKAKLGTQGVSVPNLRPLPIRKVETLLN